MTLTHTTLGSLSCQVLHEAGPSARPELCVVLCHGYGAPGGDLVPLGPELLRRHPALAGRVRFIFPEAPLSMGPGYGDARAWWHLDLERMAALQRGEPGDFSKLKAETPEGLPKARRLLIALIDELSRQMGVPLSRILLGGFSQGAMLATDVSLRLEEAPAGLAVLSGTLICEQDWVKRAPTRKGLRVLQSHGRQDPILPFEVAQSLRELLVHAGLEVEFIPFDGPHTIAGEALDRLGALIAGALPGRAGG